MGVTSAKMVGSMKKPFLCLGPREALAAADEARALLLGDLHVLEVGVELGLVHGGAHLHALVEAVAHLEGLGALGEHLDELVVDAPLDEAAARGGAALAGGAEGAPEHALDGQVEVGVVHDDDGVLAAHLQAHALEVGGAGEVDLAAHLGGAGEGDEGHVGVRAEGRARRRGRRPSRS